MGVCYSMEDDWEEDTVQVSTVKKLRKKKKKHFSVIQQERSQYDASFASILQDQYRNSLYQTIQESSQLPIGSNSIYASVVMGSVVEMNIDEQENLQKNLTTLNQNNEPHTTQLIRLCNFKTKNFLHTHKVKLQKSHHFNQVSCCPYDANHNIDYDTWQLQPCGQFGAQFFYIYHRFTKKYLQAIQSIVACGDQKYVWQIQPLGIRRNLGFLKIKSQNGYLCMTDTKGLMRNHRSVCACHQSHISHLWQLIFVE